MQGRSIIVTGGAGGLGRAYSRHLAGLGATVAVADIDGDAAEAAASDIRRAGGRALAARVDVTDERSVAEAFAEIDRSVGPIAGLVNNAGGSASLGSLASTSLLDWNRTLSLNLTGTFLCSRAIIPTMRAEGRGRIVNITSTTVDHGLPLGLGAYIAAKAGIVGLTRALARELGADRITVNAVAPGLILMDKAASPFLTSTAALVEGQKALPDPGTADDLVGIVAFLLGDEAGFITGQVYNADGGWALK